jgi:hypothetical protein
MSPSPQPFPFCAGRRLIRAVVTAAVVVAGCAGTQPEPDRETAEIEAPAAAPQPPTADRSAPAGSIDSAARVILQSRGVDPVAYLLLERSEPTPDSAGVTSWTVRRSMGPTPDGPWTPTVERHFVLTADGDIALAGETNHTEGVGLAFTPPLVVMPSRLWTGGEPFSQDTRLRVWPLANPKQTKAQGRVRQHIVHEGHENINTPSGPMEAQQITQTFEAALSPAAVRNVTRQWIVPGIGPIAEDREERTKVFGVQTRFNRESWVLFAPP